MAPRSLLALALFALLPAVARGAVGGAADSLALDARFQPGMVLQRGRPIVFAGRAAPGAEVHVRFDGEVVEARAGGDGRWAARFAPRRASPVPRALDAESGAERLGLDDLLVGDVWLVAGSADVAAPLAGGPPAPLPEHVRFWLPPRDVRYGDVVWTPAERAAVGALLAGAWTATPPDDVSGIAWQFARALAGERRVPLGIVQLAAAPTTLESWLPRPALLRDERLAARLTDWWTTPHLPEELRARARRHLAGHFDHGAQAAGGGLHPLQPGFLWDAAAALVQGMPCAGLVLGCSGEARDEPDLHEALLRALVTTWRERCTGRCPVLLLESAGRDWLLDPDGALVARRRDAERRVAAGPRALPEVGLVVRSDLDLRVPSPAARQRIVGERLAGWALDLVDGRVGCVPSGPVPVASRHDPKARCARIEFEYAEGLATADGGPPRGFSVLGPDGRASPAVARIEAGELVVAHPDVALPVEVRYGFAGLAGNLVNGAGLPAPTFRLELPELRVVGTGR